MIVASEFFYVEHLYFSENLLLPPTFENINVTFVSGLGRMYPEIAGATAGILSNRKYYIALLHKIYVYMLYVYLIHCKCTTMPTCNVR